MTERPEPLRFELGDKMVAIALGTEDGHPAVGLYRLKAPGDLGGDDIRSLLEVIIIIKSPEAGDVLLSQVKTATKRTTIAAIWEAVRWAEYRPDARPDQSSTA